MHPGNLDQLIQVLSAATQLLEVCSTFIWEENDTEIKSKKRTGPNGPVLCLEQDAIQPKSSLTEPKIFLFDVKREGTCQSCMRFNVCPYVELVLPLSNLLDPTSSSSSRLLFLEWRGSVPGAGILEAQTHLKTNKSFLSAILPLNSPSALKTRCEYRHTFLKRHNFVLLIAL